jgi:phosphohistidine phosphatase
MVETTKTIILVRHAKAVSNELRIPDFERSLLKKGAKDARKVSKILKADGIKPALFISSPANRALETAHIFAKELQYPVQKILIKDELYDSPSTLKFLKLVNGMNERYSSIMIFGHNPSFEEFASFFIKNFRKNIPTSGVVGIQFRNKLWKAINKGDGKLKFHEQPIHKSERNQIYKQARGGIETKLIKQVSQILSKIDKQAAGQISDEVKGYSQKLVNKFLKASKAYKVKRIKDTLVKPQTTRKRARSIAAPNREKKKISSQEEKTKRGSKSKKTNSPTNPSVKSRK